MQSIGRTKDNNPNDIFAIYDEFIKTESLKNSWKLATIKKFKTSKNKLFEYDKSISLENISEKKLEGYIVPP